MGFASQFKIKKIIPPQFEKKKGGKLTDIEIKEEFFKILLFSNRKRGKKKKETLANWQRDFNGDGVGVG